MTARMMTIPATYPTYLAGSTLYPAITLWNSGTSVVTANFGATAFQYPIAGYTGWFI